MSDNGGGNGSGSIGLTGFVLGALVGAGVALMYAPCSGKDTRQLLSRKTRELKDKSASLFEDTKDMVRREGKNILSEAKDIANAHGMPSYTGAASTKGRA